MYIACKKEKSFGVPGVRTPSRRVRVGINSDNISKKIMKNSYIIVTQP